MVSWKVAEAKARLSELIEKALHEGAQEITRHGRRAVVVVAAKEWDRRAARQGDVGEARDQRFEHHGDLISAARVPARLRQD